MTRGGIIILACSIGASFAFRLDVSRGDPACCKCNNGVVAWSKSGGCSPCAAGGLAMKRDPSEGCGSVGRTKRGSQCSKECVGVMNEPEVVEPEQEEVIPVLEEPEEVVDEEPVVEEAAVEEPAEEEPAEEEPVEEEPVEEEP